MKRLCAIVTILLLVISLGANCYAAVSTYDKVESVITASDGSSAVNSVNVEDEEVPEGSALPKTGGIPSEVFYSVGAIMIISAVIISRKKAQ